MVRRAVREFLAGLGHLGEGLRLWITAPKLMFIGAVPAVIVAIALGAVLVWLGFSVQGVVGWGTPYAEGWDPPWRDAFRGLLAVTIMLGGIVLGVVCFTVLTLMVGAPFYDRIRLEVDRRAGAPPTPPQRGAWHEFWRMLRDGVRTVLPAILVGALLLPLGFVPVIGQAAVAVLSAVFGGWFVAVELTGSAGDARGLTLTQRRRILRARLPRTLGLGLGVYLLFLLPFGPVFAMPAAVAGATLLLRAVRDEPVAMPRPSTTQSRPPKA